MSKIQDEALPQRVFRTAVDDKAASLETAAESDNLLWAPLPLFFWKPTQEHGYLGQWHMSAFTDTSNESQTFCCAEQYMMYHKAVLFNDSSIAAQIMRTTSPKQHKALGAKVKKFDEKVWNEHKEEIVEKGNWLKFTQSEELKNRLLSTGERELLEASPYDRIWGIGFHAGTALKVNRDLWGQNLLGKALMRVRDRLKAETQQADGETNEREE